MRRPGVGRQAQSRLRAKEEVNRKQEKGEKGGKRAKFIPFQGPPTTNGMGSVLKWGGANLNFEVRLRGEIIILKI
jgi:hypothetical protein